MTQYLTKRNIIIAAIAVVLFSVIVITVVMQLGSEMPKLVFDAGTQEEKETGMFYTAMPISWRGGTKEEKELAEIAKTAGYLEAMQGQAGCVMYPNKKIAFSFEDATPQSVNLSIYDQYGVLLNSETLTDYSITTPEDFEGKLYVLEAAFEQGTCAYVFWIYPL
ncbi:MAG: hypothetical protein E7399_06005 [Ruminococcaceae bacterium]|nr:hypothetical protein [Oscillospiraceae bacterium]